VWFSHASKPAACCAYADEALPVVPPPFPERPDNDCGAFVVVLAAADLAVDDESDGVIRRVDEGGPAATADRAADRVRRGAGVQKGVWLLLLLLLLVVGTRALDKGCGAVLVVRAVFVEDGAGSASS